MRPEVRAQKLKNNKTSNNPWLCKCEKAEIVLAKGPHSRRIKICWKCFANPPESAQKKLLRAYGLA